MQGKLQSWILAQRQQFDTRYTSSFGLTSTSKEWPGRVLNMRGPVKSLNIENGIDPMIGVKEVKQLLTELTDKA